MTLRMFAVAAVVTASSFAMGCAAAPDQPSEDVEAKVTLGTTPSSGETCAQEFLVDFATQAIGWERVRDSLTCDYGVQGCKVSGLARTIYPAPLHRSVGTCSEPCLDTVAGAPRACQGDADSYYCDAGDTLCTKSIWNSATAQSTTYFVCGSDPICNAWSASTPKYPAHNAPVEPSPCTGRSCPK